MLKCRLSGPETITIRTGKDAAFVERCRRDLVATIEKTQPWDRWTIQVRLGLDDQRQLADVDPGYGKITLLTRKTASFLGNVVLEVVFSDDSGTVLSQCTVTPNILRETQLLMVARECDRGHVLAPEDVRLTTVWVDCDAQQYVSDPASATGCELNRRLAVGELLRRNHLAAPVCARRGDLVKVIYRSGSLTLSLHALALDSGRRGDTVRLRNTTSGTVFRAVLDGRKSACLYGR
jgi:flagella basal body P-ring formation protein FlgA